MLVLVVIARENFDSGHFELFNFPGRRLLRPAFLAGIKPCDVIMHKVYWLGNGISTDPPSGPSLLSSGSGCSPDVRGVGTGGGGGHRGHVPPPPPQFFQRTKSALFVMKSALFVQANVAINTKLTSKVPFLFGNFDVFKKNLVKTV